MFKATISLSLILLLALTVVMGGCQTLNRDSQQKIQNYSRISDLNRRMLAEDMDTFWLLDRPSNLTQWYVRK